MHFILSFRSSFKLADMQSTSAASRSMLRICCREFIIRFQPIIQSSVCIIMVGTFCGYNKGLKKTSMRFGFFAIIARYG